MTQLYPSFLDTWPQSLWRLLRSQCGWHKASGLMFLILHVGLKNTMTDGWTSCRCLISALLVRTPELEATLYKSVALWYTEIPSHLDNQLTFRNAILPKIWCVFENQFLWDSCVVGDQKMPVTGSHRLSPIAIAYQTSFWCANRVFGFGENEYCKETNESKKQHTAIHDYLIHTTIWYTFTSNSCLFHILHSCASVSV